MATTPDIDSALARLHHIGTLTTQLAKTKDLAQQMDLSERIHREITLAKDALTGDPPA